MSDDIETKVAARVHGHRPDEARRATLRIPDVAGSLWRGVIDNLPYQTLRLCSIATYRRRHTVGSYDRIFEAIGDAVDFGPRNRGLSTALADARVDSATSLATRRLDGGRLHEARSV